MAVIFMLFVKLSNYKNRRTAKRLAVMICGMIIAGIFMLFAYAGYEVMIFFLAPHLVPGIENAAMIFGAAGIGLGAIQPAIAIPLGVGLILALSRIKFLDFSPPKIIEEIE
jgi:hypothetical protein